MAASPDTSDQKPPAWRILEPSDSPLPSSSSSSSWPTLAESRHHISTTIRSPPNPTASPSFFQGHASRLDRQSNASLAQNSATFDRKLKPPYKRGGSKHIFPFSAGAKTFPPPVLHRAPMLLPDQFSGTAGFPAPYPAIGAGPFYYPPFPLNVYSNLQVRGNGWASHQWRGYGYGANNNVYVQHEHYFNPGNTYTHFSPPMNMNLIHHNQQRNMYNSMPIASAYGSHSHSKPPVQSQLQKQIEYYFSTENLCKDMYLRSRMDSEGFVPVSLIASFKRVQNLTANPRLILEALQKSSVVELKGNKIRKSRDWKRWLLPGCTSSSSPNLNDANNRKDSAPIMLSSNDALVDKSNKQEIHEVEICPTEILDGQDINDGCDEDKEALIGSFTNSCIIRQHIDADENCIQTDNDSVSVRIQYGDSVPHEATSGLMNKSLSVLSSTVVDSNILINETRESSVVADDNCPSFGNRIKLYKGHSENLVEEDKRRLITVTHAQLSSCIAVP